MLKILKCKFCGHEWVARKIEDPKKCHKCRKSLSRVNKEYKFDTIRPGETRIYHWNLLPNLSLDHKENDKRSNAFNAYYARNSWKKFYVSGTPKGLKITRII